MPENDLDLPTRSRPSHWPVLDVANRSTIVFLTICVKDRRPLLAREEIHSVMIESWSQAKAWLIGRYVLLPDHIHLFCAPSDHEALPLTAWVRFWKSQSTKLWPYPAEKPIWQADFWDRQLRASESYSEQWDYVRRNPVRAALCDGPEGWPFQGEVTRFRFHDG